MASSSVVTSRDNEPLLNASEREDHPPTGEDQELSKHLQSYTELQRKYTNLRYFTYGLSFLYTILILIYIFLVFDIIKPRACYPASATPGTSRNSSSSLFPSLAESGAFRSRRHKLDVKIRGNKFSGPPRPELDAAWHELFEDIRIRVSQADLDFHGVTSVPLADESGFAAELGVHHELHCLKKIRHYIHRDYYLTNETEAEMREWPAHVDHCIEHLRQSVMCHADPSLSTFEWLHSDSPHITAVAKGYHQCVNWEHLMHWVRARSVPIFEDGVLVKPNQTNS